ncbi:MAG TPA: HD domain-containing protein [Chthoniobacterales bacterium]
MKRDAEFHEGLHLVLRALAFAARAHRHQTMPDGVTPYYSHVVRVTWIARELFALEDATALAAAALHDTIEDTTVGWEELAREFGVSVADHVQCLSKAQDGPEERRETDYLVRLRKAAEPVAIVKLADVYDNVSTRRGTAKMPKTLRNARRYLDALEGALRSVKARAALGHVEALLTEVEGGPVLS